MLQEQRHLLGNAIDYGGNHSSSPAIIIIIRHILQAFQQPQTALLDNRNAQQ
jgi:hypothetical protein